MISLLLTLAVCGFLCWLILQIPMLPLFRTVIIAFVVFCLVVYVLQVFGFHTGFHSLNLK